MPFGLRIAAVSFSFALFFAVFSVKPDPYFLTVLASSICSLCDSNIFIKTLGKVVLV